LSYVTVYPLSKPVSKSRGVSLFEPPAAREQATWVYDTALMGIGKRARETNPGFSRSYTFDPKSRPASATISIDGVDYTTSQNYDAAGRINVITYTQPVAVRQVHGPSRYLAQVQQAATGQLYWRTDTANLEGLPRPNTMSAACTSSTVTAAPSSAGITSTPRARSSPSTARRTTARAG
jgi:hypothetical protein